MSDAMTPIVRARNLVKSYGTTRALDNVSFDIESGRIVGLIGPNGAGKTTALKAILGLTDVQGELSVLGFDPGVVLLGVADPMGSADLMGM